jgi:hypothetical protein
MIRTTSKVFGSASNFRVAFLAIVAVALSYATALLIILLAYRRGHGIMGKLELALQFMGKSLASLTSRNAIQNSSLMHLYLLL